MRSGLHGDFDRGYFSAWADCMRILTRMDIPAPTVTAAAKTEDGEEKIEVVRSDKSQATIANFFSGDEKALAKAKQIMTENSEPMSLSLILKTLKLSTKKKKNNFIFLLFFRWCPGGYSDYCVDSRRMS